MEEVIEDIERVVGLLHLLKSRYIFLRSKYNTVLNSRVKYTSKDFQTEYQCDSNDLQSYIVKDFHLLEHACTYGIYSMNMFATRLKTNLLENDEDPHFLKLLKDNIRSLVETNKEITDLSIDPYSSFQSYINAFMVYANVLNGINVSNSAPLDETSVQKKKKKQAKKISKINLMANIISFLVSESKIDYRKDDERSTLNMALKYRTPRSLEYYLKIVK